MFGGHPAPCRRPHSARGPQVECHRAKACQIPDIWSFQRAKCQLHICQHMSEGWEVERRFRTRCEKSFLPCKHSKHRAAAALCPQPVREQRSLTQEGRQAESCNFGSYRADADWQSSYGIFGPRRSVVSGAAAAPRHGSSSTSYVKYVNNWQRKLAESCRSQELSFRLREEINTERHLRREDDRNILKSLRAFDAKCWETPTWSFIN